MHSLHRPTSPRSRIRSSSYYRRSTTCPRWARLRSASRAAMGCDTGATRRIDELPRWILWRFETRDESPVEGAIQRQRATGVGDQPGDLVIVCGHMRGNGSSACKWDWLCLLGRGQYIGVDLDHVCDPATGSVKPWASGVIDALKSNTELLPSGTGFHVVLRGTKAPGWQCNLRFDPVTREGFEIHSRFTRARDTSPSPVSTWRARRSRSRQCRISYSRVCFQIWKPSSRRGQTIER